jgi:predicted RNA-binding Zn ribbon-like protein
MSDTVSPETIKLLGGALCLDFVNSVDYDADDRPLPALDALVAPADLARWARRLGVTRGRRLLRIDDAELGAALALRASLYAVLAAVARGERPPRAALDHVAREHAAAAAAARLDAGDGAWRAAWPATDPRRVRFAVVTDAVAMLADAERVRRLRRCPGRDCGWLVLDTSGRRRWCDMGACGSREKMRRMYARKRAREPGTARRSG